MEDWTIREMPQVPQSSWEQSLVIQELMEQDQKERVMRTQISVKLDEYEKDIRKQVCEEFKEYFINYFNNHSPYMTLKKMLSIIDEIEQGETDAKD